MKKVWWRAGLALMGGSGPTYAHSPVPGIEGFYVGFLHPFSTPSQALLLVGLAILAGGFSVHIARWHLAAFLAATLIGVLLGNGSAQLDAMMFAATVAVCAYAALGPAKLLPLAVGLVAIGGVLIGIASVPDPGPTRDRVITMCGTMFGANVGFLYVSGFLAVFRERYMWNGFGIALRIVSAWLGAISLIMLALRFAAKKTIL